MINVSVVDEQAKVIVTEGDQVSTVLTAPAPVEVVVDFPGPAGPPGPQGVPGESGVPPGGTEGQVLQKDSSTDYDVSWADPSASGSTALEDLSDVDVSDKQSGSILYYNISSSKWEGDDVNVLVSLTDGGNF